MFNDRTVTLIAVRGKRMAWLFAANRRDDTWLMAGATHQCPAGLQILSWSVPALYVQGEDLGIGQLCGRHSYQRRWTVGVPSGGRWETKKNASSLRIMTAEAG